MIAGKKWDVTGQRAAVEDEFPLLECELEIIEPEMPSAASRARDESSRQRVIGEDLELRLAYVGAARSALAKLDAEISALTIAVVAAEDEAKRLVKRARGTQ